jgi:hypothetical protein
MLQTSSRHKLRLILKLQFDRSYGCYVKGKAVPLQAWSGPEGSRKLRFPDYMTTAQDGGKVVRLTSFRFLHIPSALTFITEL